jgi:hypothetical protein
MNLVEGIFKGLEGLSSRVFGPRIHPHRQYEIATLKSAILEDSLEGNVSQVVKELDLLEGVCREAEIPQRKVLEYRQNVALTTVNSCGEKVLVAIKNCDSFEGIDELFSRFTSAYDFLEELTPQFASLKGLQVYLRDEAVAQAFAEYCSTVARTNAEADSNYLASRVNWACARYGINNIWRDDLQKKLN